MINPYETSQAMAQKRAQMMAAALRGQAPEATSMAALPTPENVVLPTGAGGQRVGQQSGLGALNNGLAPAVADLIKNYKWTPASTGSAGSAASLFGARGG